MNKFLAPIAFTLATLAAPAAMAVTTFELLDDNEPGKCYQSAGADAFGNTRSCQAQGSTDYNDLKMTAYANTGAGGKFAAAFLAEYEGDDGNPSTPSDYDVYGYGVKNTIETMSAGSPQHAMDNDGQLELMVLKFDASIALSSIRAGWIGSDSDVSIFAYTGTGNAVTELTGATQSTLMSTGWSLIGNYANIGTAGDTAINASAVSSSYWIISAYSTSFGGGFNPNYYDYVKIKSLAGNYTCQNSNDPSCAPPPPTGVPEPVSLALVGVALFGAWGGRRRAQAQG